MQTRCRLSSLSFSFYTDKNPKRTTPLPPWILEAADSIKARHPKLFESEESSVEVQPYGVNTLLPATPATAASTAAHDGSTSSRPAPDSATSRTPITSASADATKDTLPQVHDYAVHILFSEDMASTTSFSFILEDYGQYANIERESLSKREGNCCIFLCLTAGLPSLSDPSILAKYFEEKACHLCRANVVHSRHEELQQQWQYRAASNLHLAASFPQGLGEEWAGAFRVGKAFDIDHLLLIAPCEVRNAPIVVITDNGGQSEIRIPQEEVVNHIIYFPANTANPSAPIFLRHKAKHYTLLRPPNGTSAEDVLTAITNMLPPEAIAPYMRYEDNPGNSMANLVNITTIHADLDGLRVEFSLRTTALEEQFARTLSQCMARQSPPNQTASSPNSHDDASEYDGDERRTTCSAPPQPDQHHPMTMNPPTRSLILAPHHHVARLLGAPRVAPSSLTHTHRRRLTSTPSPHKRPIYL